MPLSDAPNVSQQQLDPGMSGTMKIVVSVVTGLLIVAGISSRFVVQEKERKAMENLKQASRDIRADMKRELDESGSISSESSAKLLENARSRIDHISTRNGVEGQMMKAVSETLAEGQQLLTAYSALGKRIETGGLADMKTVKDKADLSARKKIAGDFIRMNSELAEFSTGFESRLRHKLSAVSADASSKQKFIEVFMKTFTKFADQGRRMRKGDETIGLAMAGMCDLLDAEWGRWSANEVELKFDNPAAADRYHEFVVQIQQAEADQSSAQGEMIEIQERTSR